MASPRDQLEHSASTANNSVMSSGDHRVRSPLGAAADGLVGFSDLINRASVGVGLVLLVAMLIIAVWGVTARYLLHNSLSWNEEADSYLFIWLSFLGAAMGYKERAHPSIQLLIRRMPVPFQKLFLLVTHLAVITLCGVLIWFGLELIDSVGASTASSFDMPMTFAYLALPVGSAIMVVHALANAVQDMEHPTFDTAAAERE